MILSGCGHAGIVNTVRFARKLTGNDAVAAIIGPRAETPERGLLLRRGRDRICLRAARSPGGQGWILDLNVR